MTRASFFKLNYILENQSGSRMIVVVGSANIDMVAAVDRHPEAGETTLATDYHVHHGGKGANQAVAAARMGAAVRFVGAVGDDDFGQQLDAGLRDEHIDVHWLQRIAGSSGLAMIAVDRRGENRIVVVAGANGQLAPQHLAPDAFADTSVALLQLETPAPFVQRAAEMAKHAGAEVILNAAPARTLSDADLADIDWLMVNAGEAALILNRAPAASVDEAVRQVRALTAKTRSAIITMGAQGAAWAHADEHGFCPAFESKPVDTTGAGDAFAGAFAKSRALGLAPAKCVQRASAAGALAVRCKGARDGLPTAEAVTELIGQTTSPYN